MKKQKKKKRKPTVESFSALTSTFFCGGTITECRLIDNKRQTTLKLTIKVRPEDTDADVRAGEIIDYYQGAFRIILKKKYDSEEVRLIEKFLTGTDCLLYPYYNDEVNMEVCTAITPLLSPACLTDILLPGGEFTGYEIPSGSKRKKYKHNEDSGPTSA